MKNVPFVSLWWLCSYKSSKTTQKHACPDRSRRESRTTVSALAEGICEDCVFSVGVKGESDPILTCRNKAGATGRFCIVDTDNSCTNFTADKEILAPELVRALAEGAKLLPLSQDKFAIVDSDDYDRLNTYKWCLSKTPRTNYAMRSTKARRIKGKRAKRKTILMHRFILNAPPGLVVDHINHDGLDNRKSNLRLCTRKQNNHNKRPQGKTSKYKGVYFSKLRKKFIARIQMNGKTTYIGLFTDQIAAAKAYDKKARELFGEFAYLNFP
jgi:hypothetical protein